MSFATALSGLNAANNNLSVTGNNIANANTVGFKQSVAQFADVYATSLSGNSNITPGSGVSVANDAQQFMQGTLQASTSNLNMAISGSGFFTLAQTPTQKNNLTYSRDGEFSLNADGYLVNNKGNALLAYAPNGTNVSAGFSTGVLNPVQINTLTGAPSPTSSVNMTLNLDASQALPGVQNAIAAAGNTLATAGTAMVNAAMAYDQAYSTAQGDTTNLAVVAAQTSLNTANATLTSALNAAPTNVSTVIADVKQMIKDQAAYDTQIKTDIVQQQPIASNLTSTLNAQKAYEAAIVAAGTGGGASNAAVSAARNILNAAMTVQSNTANATGNQAVIDANNTLTANLATLFSDQDTYATALQADATNGTNTASTYAGAVTTDKAAVLTAILAASNSMSTLSNTNVTNDLNLASDAAIVATDQTNITTDIQTASTLQTYFDHTNPTSYNSQTSLTVYDSLGSPHILTTFYVKGPATNSTTQWDVYSYMSEPATPTGMTPLNAGPFGTTVAAPATTTGNPSPAVLTFDSTGKLTNPPSGNFALSSYTITPPTGAAPITIKNLNLFGSTQVQSAFSVNTQKQDGLPSGQLTGISISAEGVISANFSNGGSSPLGQVALTNFPNTNGLQKIGSTQWTQSASSGSPILGTPGSNNFGSIQSGSVEASNVNLSNELVNLIVAQQAYQANAKTISTENNIMTSILQIA